MSLQMRNPGGDRGSRNRSSWHSRYRDLELSHFPGQAITGPALLWASSEAREACSALTRAAIAADAAGLEICGDVVADLHQVAAELDEAARHYRFRGAT